MSDNPLSGVMVGGGEGWGSHPSLAPIPAPLLTETKIIPPSPGHLLEEDPHARRFADEVAALEFSRRASPRRFSVALGDRVSFPILVDVAVDVGWYCSGCGAETYAGGSCECHCSYCDSYLTWGGDVDGYLVPGYHEHEDHLDDLDYEGEVSANPQLRIRADAIIDGLRARLKKAVLAGGGYGIPWGTKVLIEGGDEVDTDGPEELL